MKMEKKAEYRLSIANNFVFISDLFEIGMARLDSNSAYAYAGPHILLFDNTSKTKVSKPKTKIKF